MRCGSELVRELRLTKKIASAGMGSPSSEVRRTGPGPRYWTHAPLVVVIVVLLFETQRPFVW